MHASPAEVTGVQIAYMLPFAFLGPLAGVFVDRWPLKPTLVASDLLRAGLVVLLVVSTELWQIYAVLVVLSAVSSFFMPAQSVTIRAHVPPHGLLSANALMQIAMMGVRIVGPLTAGVLVASLGATVCYTLDGAQLRGLCGPDRLGGDHPATPRSRARTARRGTAASPDGVFIGAP